jgi:hypothetical protein
MPRRRFLQIYDFFMNPRAMCDIMEEIKQKKGFPHERTVYTDARNFPKTSGRFILYKTPEQLKEDLPEIRSCASHKNWKVTEIFELPDSAGSRQFLFY